MTDLEVMPDDNPRRATVLGHRDYEPLACTVENATVDTSIILNCPDCGALIQLGPRTGHYKNNLPWLSSLCPSCNARFRVVQRIEVTWRPQDEQTITDRLLTAARRVVDDIRESERTGKPRFPGYTDQLEQVLREYEANQW